ncbi:MULTISPECIES: HAD-IIB family hydrolase [Peptoniphilus]|uniref:HAD-IIB family hydrolase n=1 Tax=Peptoniphilus TaxID=162289 RepID=UPI0025849C69|nr:MULTISPECIES: HAD-IIB family hydrolase [Peptoniphilus]MDU1043919.1 HAD-IIB family hydrolase [Peptoniphilus rhinitidis]MDU2115701.1 HAD-IIB family hydrolase [Peptoniphilus lacydonensis]MDU3750407.1 HAD-IIB family hydrolase [Peptoniphilus rhinitidis]MDU5594848.1 HAD-IIB family hydrolase [Peptoniphilus rhinitidis]MDU7302837.1 HAD-IIB family hydrolase [Peptoniphilus lacydonensis]
MIKIVSMDLDETLLNSDKVMTKSFYNFVDKLKSNNIIPVVATGREYYSAHKFVGDVDIDLICNNGNVIKDNLTGKVEYVNPINEEDLKSVMAFDDNKNIYTSLHIATDNEIDLVYKRKNFENFEGTYIDAFRNRNLALDDFNKLEGKPLSIVFAGSHDDLVELRNRMKKEISDRFNFHIMRIRREPKWMLEVLQKNGDKFYGIKKYAENRNINLDKVAAIGDDSNDIMLIKNVGLGIAMKNSVDSLKDVADVISDFDNNNDGAIKILNKVIFGG